MGAWVASAVVRDDLRAIWEYLAAADRPGRSDVIFCFGSAHLGTARMAARLYREGVAPLVLVTGGPAGRVHPHRTEADGFAHVLEREGVPISAIVTEVAARHTGENVVLGLVELERRGVAARSATVVAFPTSLRRSVQTLHRHAPALTVRAVPAFEGLGVLADDLHRAARLALSEVDKLLRYPALGHIRPLEVPSRVLAASARLEDGIRALGSGLDEPAPDSRLDDELDDLIAVDAAERLRDSRGLIQ